MNTISHSVVQTVSLGRRIGKRLKGGDIICLFGQLGAGKTVLVKGLAQGLGVDSRRVNSPSFVLIHEYKGKLPLFHLDLYRLRNNKDIVDLGYEEYFYSEGVCVIEWADRLKGLLPKKYLKIELEVKNQKERLIKFSAKGNNYTKLIRQIYEDTCS